SMIIDVHAHGLSEDFIVDTAKGSSHQWRVEIAGPGRYVAADYGPLDPLLYDLPGRLAHLRAHDVALTRRLNASTAKLVAQGEGMLAGLAVPAVGEPARAADELRPDIETHRF